jgi:hypothetical protein
MKWTMEWAAARHSRNDGLAAAHTADEAAFEGVLWLAGVVLVLVVAAVILGYVRRRIRASRSQAGPAFTLEELRRLRDQGDLSEAEYKALRDHAGPWAGRRDDAGPTASAR